MENPIDPFEILDPPFPRHHSEEDLDQLEESVKKHGFLEPIVVTRIKIKDILRLRLLLGLGRLTVAKRLGIKVPYVVVESGTEADQLAKTFHENNARSPMSHIERAQFAQKFMKLTGCKQEQAASELGISAGMLSKLFKVNNNLEPSLILEVHNGNLEIGSAHQLGRLSDHTKQLELAALLREGKLKRSSLTKRVKLLLGKPVKKARSVKFALAPGADLKLPGDMQIAALEALIAKLADGVKKLKREERPVEDLPLFLKGM